MTDYNVKLTIEEMAENYEKLMEVVGMFKDDSRYDKIVSLFDDLAEQIAISPASGMKTYHSCYPGGWVTHTLHVIDFSLKTYELWSQCGADMSGYTIEELVFSALFHDLGKIGDKNMENYIPNPDEWQKEKQGRLYVFNRELPYIPHEERSLFLLQKYEIPVSENEYIAIRIHSGAYSERNKEYWFTGLYKANEMKTNLPIILHHADYMAYRIEIEQEGVLKPKS